MSDSLKDRLSSHSNSFEGLLSLIPARYYYDDESNSQWKKKGAARSEEEKKAEQKKARKNKFDPEVGSSALDEKKRREQTLSVSPAPNQEESDGDDDVAVIIYDDHGNPIGGKREETIEEIMRAKAQGADDGDKTSEPAPVPSKPPAKSAKKEKASKSKPQDTEKPKPKPQDTEKSSSLVKPETVTEAEEPAKEKSEESAASNSEETTQKPRPGIEELRQRLAARVNELKAKRKAPGSSAEGAPKNREELLAARKLRLEQKKSQAKQNQKNTGNEPSDSESEDEDLANEGDSKDTKDADLMFGQIQFGDGSRLSKDIDGIEEQRKRKRRNAIDQLKVLESRKNKMSKLDQAKQQEIAENSKWSRAILQSEGAKVRDDEKLLRKTIKQKQNRKKRSEKEWNQRIYNIKKGISDREAKRHANISAHKEAKKLRLKGKKRRQHMKNATK